MLSIRGQPKHFSSLLDCVATFKRQLEWGWRDSHLWILGGQPEQLSDEPDLAPNITAAHPPNLPFPDHVDHLVALHFSPSRMEFPKALFGVDPAFDRTMILLEDVVQVLDRAMATAPPKNPFLLDGRDRRGVEGRQVRIDDARLRMRDGAQSLAKQPFGSVGFTWPTIENQWWLPSNRSLDTDNTSGLLP
jgi:hypothetical protein